jgi:16S rRNA (adenine1518-N6/adenine1519-N6)-dimethyltransferase
MRQKYGQNFLINSSIAKKIVRAAYLKNQDNVLEIGPGRGILTKIIQPQVNYLISVEIDKNLFQQLNHFFSFNNFRNIKIINADFLKYDIPNTEFKIISNLPYNIGTTVIQKILPLKNWSTAIFMLQREVSRRFSAQPNCKDYGYISIFSSYYADCKTLFDVSPGCFNPRPKVFSSVIKFINKTPEITYNPIFFEFIKHAFNMRRKTILNCLSSFNNFKKNKATKILNYCNLDTFLRPDKLSMSDFLCLTNEIKKYTIQACDRKWL